MAQSKCASCGAARFEIKELLHVAGTDLRWNALQCASCGAVVGGVDFYSLSAVMGRLEKIERALGQR